MTVIEDQPRKIHPTTTRPLASGDDLSGRHRWSARQQIDFCEWQRLKPAASNEAVEKMTAVFIAPNVRARHRRCRSRRICAPTHVQRALR